jgi:hypothetical protein
MRYGLGWARLDQGLAAWLIAGRPKDGPALRLLDDVWARDGQLEWLVAWLARGALGGTNYPGDLVEPGLPATAVDWTNREGWIASATREAASTGIINPTGTGSDELHLTGCCSGPQAEPPDGAIRIADDVRPVLVADGGVGWYAALDLAAFPVPLAGVEVVSLSLGLIGSFTRSRDTGRWYLASTGEHWHKIGN